MSFQSRFRHRRSLTPVLATTLLAITLAPLAACAGSSSKTGAQSTPTARAQSAPTARKATFSASNGPIAFLRFAGEQEDDYSPQIFTRSRSGSVRQLSRFAGGAGDPEWSPDGSRIAFERWFFRQHQPDQLYTMKADGSDVQQLTTGCSVADCLFDDSPGYSPDGSQIAFVRGYKPLVFVGDEEFPSASDLMVVPAAGGTPRVLHHFKGDPQPGQPVWSPDGKRLVFALWTTKHPTKHTLVSEALNVLDVASDAIKQITPLALGASDPDWSPDGSLIVFNSQGGHSPFVYVVRPDGGGLRKLTRKTRVFSDIKSDPRTASVAQWQPTWSPDGKQIAFSKEPKPCSSRHRNGCPDRENAHNLFVMNADGSGVRRLTTSSRFEALPTWGPRR